MSKRARSARGDVVDFDLIAIRQQLASAPPAIEVDARRDYIDAKDGVRASSAIQPISVSGISEDEFSADEEIMVEEFVPEVVEKTTKKSK